MMKASPSVVRDLAGYDLESQTMSVTERGDRVLQNGGDTFNNLNHCEGFILA